MDTTKDNFRPCSQFASGHEAVIRTEKLTKRFGSFTAVDGISFSVAPGEIFGFLGANGAGKTTAMRMLCGLSKPTSGKGLVAGYDIARESEQVKRNIGYMSQKFSLYEDLKVWENIRLFGGIYGMKTDEIAAKTDSLLHTLGFEQERDALVRSLPLGWKQKLAFSVAIFHEPKIVFLDEPTGGVDPSTRRAVLGTDLRRCRPRDHGLRHHTLYGRSGILQPGLDHGGRPHRGAGHARRTEKTIPYGRYGKRVPLPCPHRQTRGIKHSGPARQAGCRKPDNLRDGPQHNQQA